MACATFFTRREPWASVLIHLQATAAGRLDHRLKHGLAEPGAAGGGARHHFQAALGFQIWKATFKGFYFSNVTPTGMRPSASAKHQRTAAALPARHLLKVIRGYKLTPLSPDWHIQRCASAHLPASGRAPGGATAAVGGC